MIKILIVDDDERMLKMFKEMFVIAGFHVLTARDGNEGIRLAVEQAPHLILLDVMMPGKDGGETATELRANEKTRQIPIAFLTNMVTDQEVIAQGGKISGWLFLSKATPKAELIRTVREILAGKVQ